MTLVLLLLAWLALSIAFGLIAGACIGHDDNTPPAPAPDWQRHGGDRA